jgi:hypothetical protein
MVRMSSSPKPQPLDIAYTVNSNGIRFSRYGSMPGTSRSSKMIVSVDRRFE